MEKSKLIGAFIGVTIARFMKGFVFGAGALCAYLVIKHYQGGAL